MWWGSHNTWRSAGCRGCRGTAVEQVCTRRRGSESNIWCRGTVAQAANRHDQRQAAQKARSEQMQHLLTQHRLTACSIKLQGQRQC